MDMSYEYPLLENVHLHVEPPTTTGKTYVTQGKFTYFHCKCDNFEDVGWGCGYRTLQSACSWIINSLDRDDDDNADILSIPDIQATLVNISDKPQSFVGSEEWIGVLEAFYVIDTLYDIPCRILHVPQSEDIKKYANIVKKYFEDYGGLIMMGGDIDAASKSIAGIHISGNQAYFLVVDPHFVGKVKSPLELIEKKFVRWQHTSQFIESPIYDLCLPQIKAKNSS